MKIKLNTSVVAETWSIKQGQIVDAASYKAAARWIANGTATVVEETVETVETADLPDANLETATIRTKRKKK